MRRTLALFGAGTVAAAIGLVALYRRSTTPHVIAPEPRVGVDAASPACQRLADQNRAMLEAVASAVEGGTPPVLDGEAVLLRACYPGPSGPWGLRLEQWRMSASGVAGLDAAEGSFRVIHDDGRGGWVEAAPKLGAVFIQAGMSYTKLDTPEAVDVDRDGAPELWLSVFSKEHEAGSSTNALFLRYRSGIIEEVPGVPRPYSELQDVDVDGLRDVLYYPYSDAGEAPCSGFPYEISGPPFLAHARPDGSFSTDDAEARRYAEERCARPDGGEPDATQASAIDPIICARLGGASIPAALALLSKRCRPLEPKDDACHLPPGVCEEYRILERWARREPPVRIR